MTRGVLTKANSLLFAGALLLLCTPLAAQQGATSGGFRGRITDPEGKPVTGAQVVARNESTGAQRGAIADTEGRYTIPLLQPGGPYTLRVTSVGFQGAERTGFNVSAGNAITVDFPLTVQAVQIAGIEVNAGPGAIDVTQGGVVKRVGQEQVENLPVAGRDFVDFLNLSPLVSPQPATGTGGQFSIGGARTSGTNVQIDGADANNMYFGENRGSSRSPFAFSLESIKEFQLITNGYDVEYGSYQGGVVNAVTKTGTNKFSGTAFLYRRDQRLTAKDFTGATPSKYNVNQFGASLSGPLIRDRLHFFASADVQRKDQPIYATVPGRSNTISQDSVNRIIAALQSPVYGLTDASSYFGQFSQGQNNLVLFGRADWDLSNKHRLTVRQNYSNFLQTNDRLSATEAISNTGPFKDKVFSTVAELNSVLTDRLFNTLRFQYATENRPRPGSDKGGYLPQFTIQGVQQSTSVFFGGDGVLFRNVLDEKKLELIDNLNYRLNAHAFKLGGSVLFGSNVNTFWNAGNGVFRFGTLTDFVAGRPNQYTRNIRKCPVPLVANVKGEVVLCPQYDTPTAEFGYNEFSAYVQDEIQATDKLLVTAGVRMTGTTFDESPGEFENVKTVFGYSTDVVPSFTGFSPRLSATYDMGQASGVVRAGVALLVGRAPTVLAGNVFSTNHPTLAITCTGTDIPSINMTELLAGAMGENNPASCKSGGAPTGRPEYTLFSSDFKLPQTFKASVGLERMLTKTTKFGVDLIYSNSYDQFTVKDLNVGASSCQTAAISGHDPEAIQPCFTLASELNRPVYVPRAGFNPRNAATTTQLMNTSFGHVYYNVSDGEARAYNATVSLDQQISNKLQFGLSYAWVKAMDNSSFSCCTSNEGWGGEPVAGNPNVPGDPGDTDALWGTSRFERRHTFVANFLWHAPLGINLSGIWRTQSGTPWTPVVDGDLNGDGQNFNDRIALTSDLQFRPGANGVLDKQNYDLLVDRYSCLKDQVGKIVERNSCRNPWWHSLDMRLAKQFTTFRGQHVEVLADFFNVLNGLNKDWGRYMVVTGNPTDLLRAESFDATTGKVVYSVNYRAATATTSESGFGVQIPLGFDPFQFQAQLGLRYRF